MSLLMGIDLGSTSIKAVVYDLKGNMIAQGSSPTVLSHLDTEHPSWAVWEPDKIWGAVCSSVKKAVAGVSDPFDIKGIAVTGFGMDGLPISADGEALYPMISWHCPRTDSIAKEFSARVGQDKIFDIAGAQMMIINSIYRTIWMQQNHPEIIEKTDKWLLIEDFVNFKLCGEKATDFSMAWNTSVLDQKKMNWSDELIEAAGVPRSIFPEIKKSGTVLGGVTKKAAAETGLEQGTSIVLGGHDYMCASLAVGAVESDSIMDITGTWEMLLQPYPVLSHEKNIFDSGYYVQNHVVKNRFCFVASVVCGDMMEWLKNNLSFEELQIQEQQGINVWQSLMEKAKSSTAGANGCFFLPHFSGAGTPILDSKSLGAFVGLSNSITKSDMIRAIVEGLDYQFREMIEALENALSISPKRIISVGGATKNEFWMQNKADICNKMIEVPEVYEATPLGAAMLAGIGLGIYKDEKDAIDSVYKAGKVYEPNSKLTALYDEYYNEIYKGIYGNLHKLNEKIFNKFR